MYSLLLWIPLSQCYLPPFPVLWDSVQFSGLPTDPEARVQVDAWNYTHRLAMYKHLLASTPHCLWNSSQSFGNPLWGLPLQHGWQEFTGRLCINASAPKHQTGIKPSCWWGCANYYFTVLPYMGARLAGVTADVKLAATPGGDLMRQFCDGGSSQECIRKGGAIGLAIHQWSEFFRMVSKTRHSCTPTSQPDPNSPLMSKLMGQYWLGHTATINATTLCEAHLDGLGPVEAKFADGWSNLVKFLGPTRFNVNYSMTTELQNLLPYRMLNAQDRPGHIPDMDKATNHGVEGVEMLQRINNLTRGKFLDFWEYAMCSDEVRSTARDAIHRGLTDTTALVEDSLKIMWELITTQKNCTKAYSV